MSRGILDAVRIVFVSPIRATCPGIWGDDQWAVRCLFRDYRTSTLMPHDGHRPSVHHFFSSCKLRSSILNST